MRLLLGLALLLSIGTKAQDTVRLKHKEYQTVFSKSLKYPVLVEWWLTNAKVTCTTPLARKDQFAPDPLLRSETDLQKYYTNSGYDRGHMAPAADNQCSGTASMTECFYFSNMAPQLHALNGGDWALLENYTRSLAKQYDSVKVWCGSVGEIKKIGLMSVPTKCWKVIYVKKTGVKLAYIFNNDTSKSDGIQNNLVNLQDIFNLTGYRL
jgi:endonuclease G